MSPAPTPARPSVNSWSSEYLDAQYEAYLRSPESVEPGLRSFFEGFDLATARGVSAPPALNGAASAPSGGDKQAGVDALVDAYRREGHLAATIDPFNRERQRPRSLDPAAHGLTDADRSSTFRVTDPGGANPRSLTLAQIIDTLERAYCGTTGVEVMHARTEEERAWLTSRIEREPTPLERGERAHILYQLHRAELFEYFCGKRYPGVKRFSLEGAESVIPMLDRFVEVAGERFNVEELMFGMSHRGRLNVLTNILGKTYEQIFTEFDDAWKEHEGEGGDVKYHRGFSSNRVLPSGKHIWLSMASNPSHLEAVNAVVLGRCRAKQRLHGDSERNQVMPIILHGDAAVIGQGVVTELLNMSQLPAYNVGGTVHIVVNNLLGFTTGPEDGRSSTYCTDVAKMTDAPALHVNGEDPEACVRAIEIAIEYRMRFKKDVFIDLLCYRKHGHNETDEAAFTQPKLYALIRKKPSVLKTYAERLLADGVINETDMEEIRRSLEENLDKAYLSAKKTPVDPTPDPGHRQWVGLSREWSFEPVHTSVRRDDLLEISRALGTWPDDFTPHPKLVKLMQQRAAAVEEDKPLDWAMGELLAVGSLLIEGVIVRMSGQDSRRGTFSHRHAVLTDNETANLYVPLNHIREQGVPGTNHDVGTVNDNNQIRQAKYCVYDSCLSEYAVMGFEYGFSLASPRMLVLWEAQFGDFSNGAQVMIDQFIASAESKWHRWSGLTLLLPHGYEGQGPEHSSARLERFLKLCGENNMQVCYPSTPAQNFHMLRRQVLRNFRKPLIVMTPKSLLRLPAASSSVADLTDGGFQEVLDDPMFAGDADRKGVRKVILCTGKVYYDLAARREEIGRNDSAIVRVEQLYPLNYDRIEDIVNSYPNAEVVWVQEEPKNMGAWGHMFISLHEGLGWTLPYIGRPASATPATGSPSKHKEQLDAFLTDALGAPEGVAAAS